MMKVSGIWVSPFEVEACLVGHRLVLEAALPKTATGKVQRYKLRTGARRT